MSDHPNSVSSNILGNILLGRGTIVGILYLLLSYPLFYYSYKFCLPDFGGEDFYAYYPLYESWAFEKMDCPFNMRLISSFAIYVMNQVGFNYSTEISFAAFRPDYDQQIFFNAILFNYLCVLGTCIVIYKSVQLVTENHFYAFLFGGLYLLGFGTIFFSLKPTSDSCGVLLLALTYYFYLRQSNWAWLFLFLSLFQREYVFFVFGLLSLLDYVQQRKKFHLGILIFSVLLFIMYFVLRKTLFYTPRFEHQVTLATYINSIIHPQIDWEAFIKQSFFISNIFILYLLLILYKWVIKSPIHKAFVLSAVLLFVQVIAISILSRLGNNAGRYFYYTVPVLLFFIAFEIKPLVSNFLVYKK